MPRHTETAPKLALDHSPAFTPLLSYQVNSTSNLLRRDAAQRAYAVSARVQREPDRRAHAGVDRVAGAGQTARSAQARGRAFRACLTPEKCAPLGTTLAKLKACAQGLIDGEEWR